MRNLGDLNDLYNTQNVIVLTEIIESRFEAMKNTYGFNPRKCNSASPMSGCLKEKCQKLFSLCQQNTIMLKFLEKL